MLLVTVIEACTSLLCSLFDSRGQYKLRSVQPYWALTDSRQIEHVVPYIWVQWSEPGDQKSRLVLIIIVQTSLTRDPSRTNSNRRRERKQSEAITVKQRNKPLNVNTTG